MGIRSWLFGNASPLRRIVAFEAGRNSRRMKGFTTTTSEINTQIRRYGPTVVARSRYLAVNNPYAANARQIFVSALVGSGIKPSSLVEDPELKAEIAETWLAWTDEADADGVTDLYGMQSMIAGELFEAGEVFIRFRPRRVEDGLTVPLQLQIIPAEMLPTTLNEDRGPAGFIESGIQFGPIGNRLAYWFLTRHPGSDLPRLSTDPALYNVVPADQILHLFRPISAGQIRGLPHTLSAIISAAILDSYDDAELERKRIAALFGAFVTRPAPEAGDHPLEGGDPSASDLDAESASAGGDWALEPGAAIDLGPGEDVKFAEPADVGGSYEAFQYRNLLRMAAGYGVPYAAMTGDLRQTSYGSIRAGLIEFRRRIDAMQYQVLVFQFCRPVWARWMADAIVAGALPISAGDFLADRKEFLAVKWQTPRWEWIDPLNDLQAEKLAVEAGFKARSDVIDAQGLDPEETDKRIAADQDRAESLGISFDVGKSGVSSISIGEGNKATPTGVVQGGGDAPGGNAPADGTMPPANMPMDRAPSLSINIPTPWPHGEEVKVLEHDAVGRVVRFVKRPLAVGE